MAFEVVSSGKAIPSEKKILDLTAKKERFICIFQDTGDKFRSLKDSGLLHADIIRASTNTAPEYDPPFALALFECELHLQAKMQQLVLFGALEGHLGSIKFLHGESVRESARIREQIKSDLGMLQGEVAKGSEEGVSAFKQHGRVV